MQLYSIYICTLYYGLDGICNKYGIHCKFDVAKSLYIYFCKTILLEKNTEFHKQ